MTMNTPVKTPSKSPVRSAPKSAPKWLAELGYPELWEAIDEALLETARHHPEAGYSAERWVRIPKRVRANLHGHLRNALRRRMDAR